MAKSRTDSEYTKIYSEFVGVDLSGIGSNISPRRLAYSENMYRDYDGEGAGLIESVPGYRRLFELDGRINGIFTHKPKLGSDILLIHAKDKLYLCNRFTGSAEKIASLADSVSHGFSLGEYFFLLDGEKILRINSEGSCMTVGTDLSPYVPTLYFNGETFEQRNLLCDKFKEQITVTDARDYSYGTPGLKYAILDEDMLLCSVVGIDENHSGDVYIPSKVTIGDKRYTVYEIGDYALSYNDKLTAVYIGEGVKRIGNYSFRHSHYIKTVVLPDTAASIGASCFSDCSRMEVIHLGLGLKSIDVAAFSACIYLSAVTYSGGEDDYELIEGTNYLGNVSLTVNTRRTDLTVEIPIKSMPKSVNALRIDGREVEFSLSYDNGSIVAVAATLSDSWELNGRIAEIEGELFPLSSSFDGVALEGEGINSRDAILGCTIAELFDGRIFLSGNPRLPNTVFYSSLDQSGRVNPLYFGELNYFNDGLGGYNVVSLLSVRDSLAVFKSGDDGAGCIFYHTPKDSGDGTVPRIYPVKAIHSGFFGCTESHSFLDDPVFLSPSGLFALEMEQINLERSVVCRSHNVNHSLLKENLERAYLTQWLGYLAVGVGGKIYLADSRATFRHESGAVEYEWFILNGIGSYKNATRVYRYDSTSYAHDIIVYPNPDTKVKGEVWSRIDEGGRQIYYTEEAGVMYAVYPTEEMIGGAFFPATVFHSDGTILYFGTEDGVVCQFNNDLRSIPPDRIKSAADYNEEEYLAVWGGRLHPDFYAFDSHAPKYSLCTAYDNCSLPHLTKSTSKHSVVIKCRGAGKSLRCEVGTDGKKYGEIAYFPGTDFSFSELDFSSFSFLFGDYHTVPLSEKEKGWIEKQITVYQDEYASPIGIYSIAYRYTVKGRIKRT
jgi:hypothetical protein